MTEFWQQLQRSARSTGQLRCQPAHRGELESPQAATGEGRIFTREELAEAWGISK